HGAAVAGPLHRQDGPAQQGRQDIYRLPAQSARRQYRGGLFGAGAPGFAGVGPRIPGRVVRAARCRPVARGQSGPEACGAGRGSVEGLSPSPAHPQGTLAPAECKSPLTEQGAWDARLCAVLSWKRSCRPPGAAPRGWLHGSCTDGHWYKSAMSRHQWYRSLPEWVPVPWPASEDRKSTRLNSSHVKISYAVFCLKKKNNGTL